MMNVMNGEHGGSVFYRLAKDWPEEEECRNPFSGFPVQCRSTGQSDRDDVPVNWEHSLCPIDRT